MRNVRPAPSLGIGKPVLHILQQVRLVAFQCQIVIGMAINNAGRTPFLRAHGVNGHATVLHIQQLEQFGNGSNFVALIGHFQLPRLRRFALAQAPTR
jgi:hypothetical protein